MGALDGVRGVDFGQWIAGPLAAMLLGDQGAEVRALWLGSRRLRPRRPRPNDCQAQREQNDGRTTPRHGVSKPLPSAPVGGRLR